MFTGLVQEIGRVIEVSGGEDSREISLGIGALAGQMSVGDSINVNGVCLTATEIKGEIAKVDVMIQTLRLSNLGSLNPGSLVNLELAVLATSRLGGHLVQGHVDGSGRVIAREPGDHWERLLVSIPSDLLKYVVAQGSITIDGVSLTVGSVDDSLTQIELWLIPETLAKTILGNLKKGDLVNIEVDVLAKYVERLLAKGETS